MIARPLRWILATLYVATTVMIFSYANNSLRATFGWSSRGEQVRVSSPEADDVDATADTKVNITAADDPYVPSAELVDALADIQVDAPPSDSTSPTIVNPIADTKHEAPLESPLSTVTTPKKETPSSSSSSSSGSSSSSSKEDTVDWSRFAYTQYVTNHDYLCNSVMLLESLHRLGSKADRVIMYPREMLPDPTSRLADQDDDEGKLLVKARDQYGVTLIPVDLQHKDLDDPTWADSYTKLLAFNQTQYDRVLSIDSDGMILQHMDELFLLPPAPLAAPRAYWLLDNDPPEKILSSQLMLLQPSVREFDRIAARIEGSGDNEFDMEIVNQLYLDAALVLPHRPYDMLTAEFRRGNHAPYLGSDAEPWDPLAAYNEAKYVHFSDWPVPKPWFAMDDETREEAQPACIPREDGTEDCLERTLWSSFYEQFAQHRLDVCGIVVDHDTGDYRVWKRKARR